MKRTLSVLLALFLISAIAGAWLGAGHCQEKPQATNRQQAALTLVDESAQAVASAVARWRTRFVERLRRADGTPLAAQDVLEAALDTDRVVGELRREFSELKGALPNPDTDSDALLDRLDALAESAIVARWQLAQAETHLAIQLIQGEYDDAIAAAQKRFGPSQREAYAEAEWQARRAAMAAYTAETDSLAESRRRARLAFDRWAAGLVRQPTTRRMAEAIETHLNVSPGCEAAVKTSLDRFLCEHEIIFGGATAVIEAPRARMADAFDAYEVELESVPEAGVAGYPFLKPDVARFVASYESLEAPIWPPERHPWARTLPPQIATALERGSRILLFHGLGIVSADGSEPAIESEDPKILYQLLATARGSVPEEGRDPVTWDGYMREGWSRPAWLTLQRSLLPLDASERWRETIAGADLVMVLAKVLPGALPGQKNLRLAGLPAYWILPAGTANADVDFVRERVPDDFEPVRHGFIGERLRVAVRLDVPVPLDAIPVAIAADPKAYPETQAGAAAVSRTLIATKDSADPRLYVSQPFGLEWLPDYIRVKSPGVIPAYSDDGLVAGVDTNAVRLRSPGRMTVVRDPDSIVNSWRRAVDRVAGLHGVTVGPDLRAFLRRQAESFTTHLRYRLPKTATDIADAEFVTVDVALGHHAALLLLRDELIRALKEVQADMAELETAYQAGDVRARTHLRQLEIELADSNSTWQVVPVKGPADFNSLPRPGNFEVSRLGEFWSAARGEVPLARIIDEAYLARHFEPFEAQRWRVSAAYEGIAYFKNALQTSIQHAQRIKDADIEGMLHLVRFGFAPIVARVLPDIVMRTPSNSPSPWRSDADSRQYVRGVLDVADRFGTGREIGATQRSIAFAALALGTVVAAPEVLAFRVLQVASAGLGAIDLAAFTIPEYLKRRAEVAFAIGASPVLGTGRLQWAEARAIPEWSVVLDGVLAAQETSAR
jgi:hypothetical protein